MFKTLEHGAIVSLNDESSKTVQHQPTENLFFIEDTKSIETLMRDRCIQSTTQNENQHITVSAEAILESLCLHASMLLLSPQKMAMELSPSQLDVLETVLYQQMEAVKGAHQIHDRLRVNMSMKAGTRGDESEE